MIFKFKHSRIKKFLYIFLVSIFFVISFTQTLFAYGVPSTLSYQGKLVDSGGNPLGGGGTIYYFKFSLWDSPTPGEGTKLWPIGAPGSSALTVKQGSFSVNIGGDGYPDILDYDFNTNSNIYLQVEVSSDDNTFETLAPRSPISSTAFSQVANAVNGTADSSFGTTTPFADTLVSMISTAINKAVLTIKGAAGQVANLFNIKDSSNNTLFTVTSDGKVGVGTSTPSSKLALDSGQLSVPVGSASLPSYTFGSSLTTGIYSGSANTIDFATNGTNKWTITSAGSFTGSGGLTAGFLYSSSAGSASAPAIGWNSATDTGFFRVGTTGSAQIGITTSGVERMRFDANGNIGIGTSTPSGKLEIISNSATTKALILKPYTGSSVSTLEIQNASGAVVAAVGVTGNLSAGNIGSYTGQISGLLASVSAPTFSFNADLDTGMWSSGDNTLNFSTNALERMRVTSAGNLGIGTTTPATILSIGSGQIGVPLGLVTAPSYSFNGDVDTGIWSPSSNAVAIAAGSNDVFRIDNTATGKMLGSAPQLTLENLSGNAVNAGTLVYRTSGGAESFTSTFNASDNNFYFKYGGTTIGSLSSTGWGFGATAFDNSATVHIISTAEQFRSGYDASNYWNATTNSTGGTSFDAVGSGAKFSFSDNLGIGTTTPTQALSVVGSAQFTAVGSGAYAYDLNLTSEGILTTSASDQRLKTNIQILDSKETLDKIIQLKPSTFDWKSNSSHDIGLIAQEVETIFPELVFTNPTDGYKGINYSRLPALLVSALQEIVKKVEVMFAWFGENRFNIQGEICVDDVCVTKEQFKEILRDGGGQNIPTNNSNVNPEEKNDSTNEDLGQENSDTNTIEGDIPIENTSEGSETTPFEQEEPQQQSGVDNNISTDTSQSESSSDSDTSTGVSANSDSAGEASSASEGGESDSSTSL